MCFDNHGAVFTCSPNTLAWSAQPNVFTWLMTSSTVHFVIRCLSLEATPSFSKLMAALSSVRPIIENWLPKGHGKEKGVTCWTALSASVKTNNSTTNDWLCNEAPANALCRFVFTLQTVTHICYDFLDVSLLLQIPSCKGHKWRINTRSDSGEHDIEYLETLHKNPRRGLLPTLFWNIFIKTRHFNKRNSKISENSPVTAFQLTSNTLTEPVTYLAELRVDMILPPTGLFSDPLAEGGLVDVGERCGVFLVTGDLDECLEYIFAWFASLFGQPDKLE